MSWHVTADFGQLTTQKDNHTNKRSNTERPNPQSLKEGHKKAAAKGPFLLNRQKATMEKYRSQIITLSRKPIPRISGIDEDVGRSSVYKKHLWFFFKSYI